MLADAARFGDLTTAEVVSDAAVVMFGGIDTTDGMIANAVLHLLSDPGQLELVRVDPRLVPAAIEESLRLEPAAALVDRYATRDVTIGEARVRVGDGDDGDDRRRSCSVTPVRFARWPNSAASSTARG